LRDEERRMREAPSDYDELFALRREVLLLTRTVALYEEMMAQVLDAVDRTMPTLTTRDLDDAIKLIRIALKAGRAGE
jgi:hypothetical protein